MLAVLYLYCAKSVFEFQEEDIDCAIALSLSELDQKGKSVAGKFHQCRKDNCYTQDNSAKFIQVC